MRSLLADPIIGYLTGEMLMAEDIGPRHRPSREEVARLAFHFYEQRARVDGNDVSDWLQAESELRRHYV
jgi:hypothetical protein